MQKTTVAHSVTCLEAHKRSTRSSLPALAIVSPLTMVISDRVKSQFFEEDDEQRFIRISQRHVTMRATARKGTPWTHDEHERFLSALEAHPSGPWKVIASYVATRTTRQTMTHAQKYREKLARVKRAMKDSYIPSCSFLPPPGKAVETTRQANRSSQRPGNDSVGSYKTEQLFAGFESDVGATDAFAAWSGSNANFALTRNDIDEMYNATYNTPDVSAGVDELMEVPADLWWQVVGSSEWAGEQLQPTESSGHSHWMVAAPALPTVSPDVTTSVPMWV